MGDFDVRLKSNGNYWQAWWPDAAAPDGRRVKSLGSKAKFSSRQARAKCRALAMDLSMGRVTVSQAGMPRLSAWLETHKGLRGGVSESTRQLDAIVGGHLARFFDQDPRIDGISRNDAADWRAALASGELNLDNKDYCDPPVETTVCKYVRTAKAMFNVAVDRVGLTFNPFDKLKGHAPGVELDWQEVTAADMAKILDACPNDGYRALFALSRWAGLRRDEARRLQWGDVLWDKNKIMVNVREKRQTTKWRRRVCPIEPARTGSGLAKLLREWFNRAPAGSAGPCEGVSQHNLYPKTKRILTAAGLVYYHKPYHTLRKCWETELSMIYPLHVVVAWLGNTFDVARKHYLRVPDALYVEAAAQPVQIVPEPASDGRPATVPPAHPQQTDHAQP